MEVATGTNCISVFRSGKYCGAFPTVLPAQQNINSVTCAFMRFKVFDQQIKLAIKCGLYFGFEFDLKVGQVRFITELYKYACF